MEEWGGNETRKDRKTYPEKDSKRKLSCLKFDGLAPMTSRFTIKDSVSFQMCMNYAKIRAKISF